MTLVKQHPFESRQPCLIISSMSAYLPAKRPLSVTLTLWGVILFGLWNSGRALSLYLQLDVLLNLDIHMDPRIRLGMASVWALLFFWLVWALHAKKTFSRIAIPTALGIFALSDFILHLFVPTAVARAWWLNGLFFAIITLLFYWALNNSRAKIWFAK